MPDFKKQYQALVKVHYDLFGPSSNITDVMATPVSLPDVAQLYRMYERINAEYFGGRLPVTRIAYSDRMLIAGSYAPSNRIIKIGRRYHEIFPEEIEDTLKHEMIHILCPNHDHDFKAWAKKLGASLRARSHPLLRSSLKYLYVCPVCGREYPRRKRLCMASCGVCSKGHRFDPRFKLKLVRPKNRSKDD